MKHSLRESRRQKVLTVVCNHEAEVEKKQTCAPKKYVAAVSRVDTFLLKTVEASVLKYT